MHDAAVALDEFSRLAAPFVNAAASIGDLEDGFAFALESGESDGFAGDCRVDRVEQQIAQRARISSPLARTC